MIHVTLFLPSEEAITQAISDGVLNIAASKILSTHCDIIYYRYPHYRVTTMQFPSVPQFNHILQERNTRQLGGGSQVAEVSEGEKLNGAITGI
ncbi:hypothetical protein INT43_005161 [Umbelopsis isabellina]|uniref:Uncharacterized protein n=1 Tax=Mortierella isabellina TaxID=91625 RepID=A0A8H7PGW1_MORIS|nr:hypothetical protein INT43_005161 [Umbelopsis isabellina]